jgi:uncharacterized protein YndB with AHSA1/START domain
MSDVNLALSFKVDPQRLFDVCIDPVALTTWFAEHVDISIEEERYDFWGRYTPGTPSRTQGRHRLTRIEPDRAIEYEWSLRGKTTSVQYEIIAEGSGSLFRLRHTGLPPLKPYQSSIGDFWTHVLEGLRNWIDHGKAYPLIDYSNTPKGDVTLSLDITADGHDVFQALVDPYQLNRWIAKDAKVEPEPGGAIDYGWGAGPVKILELLPDRKLSYSWKWAEEPETVATWTLEDSGGKTRLTIVQSGFAPDRDSEDYYVGWYKYAHRLKSMLEVGPGWERVRIIEDTTSTT